MSTVIELSNGNSAVLIDTEDVSQRRRRPVERALMTIYQGSAKDALDKAGDLSEESKIQEVAATLDLPVIDQYTELNDLLVLARLESWTFDMPVCLDSLLDLNNRDYETLQKAVAGSVMQMVPSFGINTNPDSPTKPSDV